jgi:hypothetical protein
MCPGIIGYGKASIKIISVASVIPGVPECISGGNAEARAGGAPACIYETGKVCLGAIAFDPGCQGNVIGIKFRLVLGTA